jgi:hypothetical protein
VALAALALLVPACGQDGPGGFGSLDSSRSGGGPTSSSGGPSASSGGGSLGTSSGGSSSGASGSSGGTSSGGSGSSGSSGGPPPPQQGQPGGFQQTIAPLLDSAGCTECHHHGRPIDLTTYPFMAGTPSDTANQLLASLTTNMPPSPRTAAPLSVGAAIQTWIAAGMKP